MIIVMDDGSITGVGTHEELLASNTEYQEIYHSQTETSSSAAQTAAVASAEEVHA